MLSGTGRVVAMNPDAHHITGTASFVMLGREKRLVFRDPRDEEAYLKALTQTLYGPHVRLSAFPLAGAPVATAVVIPFGHHPHLAHAPHVPDPHALIVIRQASDRVAPKHLFQALFGLTGAESEMANALSLGMSVSDAAQTLGISRTTARNQLSAAMTKMGVHRQAQLVATIAALAPRLRLSEK